MEWRDMVKAGRNESKMEQVKVGQHRSKRYVVGVIKRKGRGMNQ